MVRASTLTALGLAIAFGGAAIAQQATGAATASGGTADVGAPASDETGVKGVYSTKRTMGIATGQAASPDAEASEDTEDTAEAEQEGDQPASN